jgi:hypothetical protein
MFDRSLDILRSAGIYIAICVAWGELFRAFIDPWVCLLVPRGLRSPRRAELFGLTRAAWLLLGAMAPILALAVICFSTRWIPDEGRDALYLMSWAFLAVFLIQQTRRKGHAPETRDLAPSSVSRRGDLVQLPREEDS